MPKQVCANRPSCSALVEVGIKYCEGCVAGGAGKDLRPSASRRGYGARWQKASKAYLLAHPIAADYFGHHGGKLYPAEHVDHIVPHRGDMTLFWDSSNWQGLTQVDHNRKTALEDGGFGRASSGS